MFKIKNRNRWNTLGIGNFAWINCIDADSDDKLTSYKTDGCWYRGVAQFFHEVDHQHFCLS